MYHSVRRGWKLTLKCHPWHTLLYPDGRAPILMILVEVNIFFFLGKKSISNFKINASYLSKYKKIYETIKNKYPHSDLPSASAQNPSRTTANKKKATNQKLGRERTQTFLYNNHHISTTHLSWGVGVKRPISNDLAISCPALPQTGCHLEQRERKHSLKKEQLKLPPAKSIRAHLSEPSN